MRVGGKQENFLLTCEILFGAQSLLKDVEFAGEKEDALVLAAVLEGEHALPGVQLGDPPGAEHCVSALKRGGEGNPGEIRNWDDSDSIYGDEDALPRKLVFFSLFSMSSKEKKSEFDVALDSYQAVFQLDFDCEFRLVGSPNNI